jgi:hypothetical protein
VTDTPDARVSTLGADLALLSVHAGHVTAEVMAVGLMGSGLVQLAALGRVTIVNGRIHVVDPSPTGDAGADAALRSLRRFRRPPTAAAWCSRPRTGIYNAYLAQLAAAGAIRLERRTLLGLIPARWQISDTAREAQVRARLDAIADGTGPVDLADAAYGGLAYAMGLPARLYPRITGRHQRRRLQEIATGAWTTGPAGTGDGGGPDGGASDAARHAAHHSAHAASHAATHAAVSAAVHSATHAAVSAATHAAVSAAHSAHSAHGGGHGGGGHGGGGHH